MVQQSSGPVASQQAFQGLAEAPAVLGTVVEEPAAAAGCAAAGPARADELEEDDDYLPPPPLEPIPKESLEAAGVDVASLQLMVPKNFIEIHLTSVNRIATMHLL